jgi:hypothetical protein
VTLQSFSPQLQVLPDFCLLLSDLEPFLRHLFSTSIFANASSGAQGRLGSGRAQTAVVLPAVTEHGEDEVGCQVPEHFTSQPQIPICEVSKPPHVCVPFHTDNLWFTRRGSIAVPLPDSQQTPGESPDLTPLNLP